MNQLNTSNSIVRDFVLESRTAVLNLLVAQYRAAGSQKNENVLKFIAERIERLGGEVPLICIRKKFIDATRDLVQAAIDIVPHLAAFNNRHSGLDGWYVQSVQSALSDAYKLASSEKILGVDITNFVAAAAMSTNAEKSEAWAKAMVGMVISPRQYIDLLVNVVPLAYTENPVCGLWLNEKREPGKPLQNLIKDIDRLVSLSEHLLQAERLIFSKAIDLARLAHSVRTQYPLNRNGDTVIETDDVYVALAAMLKYISDEDTIEKSHKAFTYGTV